MNIKADINSQPVRFRQFDPDAPMTKRDALLEGDSEIAADEFIDWLCSDGRETLYHLIIKRLDAPDVKAAASEWAAEENEA